MLKLPDGTVCDPKISVPLMLFNYVGNQLSRRNALEASSSGTVSQLERAVRAAFPARHIISFSPGLISPGDS